MYIYIYEYLLVHTYTFVYMYRYSYEYLQVYIEWHVYMYTCIFTYIYTHTHTHTNRCIHIIRFHKSILLIVQYKYIKSCAEDFILKNLILRTRSCGTAFITQHSWLVYFRQADICLVEIICTTVVPASKGHLGGASP